jgi:hypothetical protein
VLTKREIRAAADKGHPPQDHVPFDFSLLLDDTEEYIVTGGVFKGQRGFFARDKSSEVNFFDLAGQLYISHRLRRFARAVYASVHSGPNG